MNEPGPDGPGRYDRYAAAKATLGDALSGYLAAVAGLGGDDAASSLELARAVLMRDLNAAVDAQVLSVPLTDVWAELTTKARPGDRLDRG